MSGDSTPPHGRPTVTVSTAPAPRPGVTARLDVVVVNYETPDLLAACLESVRRFGTAAVHDVVVVDNSPSLRSADLVAAGFPEVRLVRPRSNLGYGVAANEAVRACTNDYVLVLNADTCLVAGAVAALLDELDRHPECAVAGPRLVDDRGRTQPSCAQFPTCSGVLLHETGAWKLLARTRFGARARPFYELASPGAVPWVLGAALALRRRSFLAAGGFDRAFFMYFEEVDLCRRLADGGASTRYVPAAVVRHLGGASTSQAQATMQRTMYRSLATYQRRHGSDPSLRCLRSVVVVIAATRACTDAARALISGPRRSVGPVISGWAMVAADAVHDRAGRPL